MNNPKPEDLLTGFRIPEQEIELLYSVDWWDGPISGLAKHKDQHLWFNFYCDDGEGVDYYYKLHPILPTEEEEILAWCAEFKERQHRLSIALNNSYYSGPEAEKLKDDWKVFCDTLPDYTTRPWTSWFCSGQNNSFYGIQVTKAEET